jgi:hypothetical protein
LDAFCFSILVRSVHRRIKSEAHNDINIINNEVLENTEYKTFETLTESLEKDKSYQKK